MHDKLRTATSGRGFMGGTAVGAPAIVLDGDEALGEFLDSIDAEVDVAAIGRTI
jgi:hypothetical protein